MNEMQEDPIVDLFKKLAVTVRAGDRTFRYLPYWVEDLGEGRIKAHKLSDLPGLPTSKPSPEARGAGDDYPVVVPWPERRDDDVIIGPFPAEP